MEQRVCIKFCYRLGMTPTKAFEMLQTAFGNDCMGRSQCFDWYSKFKAGQTSVSDKPRPGRPVTASKVENVELIHETVNKDRRQRVSDIASAVGVSVGTCHQVLTQTLEMRKTTAKFVPRLLTDDQMKHRVDICKKLLKRSRCENAFKEKIITGDETWIYCYDPETKQQSAQWKSPGSPRPKKARQVKSKIKSMLIVFFDCRGIVHREFVPQGQPVNQHFYIDVLRRLREDVRRKRPGLWASGDWLLHIDNAPAHSALLVQQYLESHNMETIAHPPYSPDLAPCDFFLFPKLKVALKGHRFDSVNDLQSESQKVLDMVSVEELQGAFCSIENRWNRCIDSRGDYFEGFNEE